jgi:hypothetical protein
MYHHLELHLKMEKETEWNKPFRNALDKSDWKSLMIYLTFLRSVFTVFGIFLKTLLDVLTTEDEKVS